MKRVYIVEAESVSALGLGREQLQKNLRLGLNGAAHIEQFATAGLPNTAAAEIKTSLAPFISKLPTRYQDLATFDRKSEILLALTEYIKEEWRVSNHWVDSNRFANFLGLGIEIPPIEKMAKRSGVASYTEWLKVFDSKEAGGPHPIGNPSDFTARYIAHAMCPGSRVNQVVTACSSSAQSLGLAFRALRRGECDVAVAGGSDSLINILGYITFLKMGVLPPGTEAPEKQCKPLDLAREGTLLGEGATLFLLANEDIVQKWRLTPRAEFLGYGSSLDAYKITAPDPEGLGMETAMLRALADAKLEASSIDYVNLHGTGTKANDPAEVQAVARVLGEGTLVSSTKDRHGHCISGAGALEAMIAMLSLETGFVPGTLNLDRPIPSLGLEFLKGVGEQRNPKIALSNSFAFGGINASLIFGKA